jgi:peptidoglycan/xylan/chitin deacetylase (PgdA/CDA1 family)
MARAIQIYGGPEGRVKALLRSARTGLLETSRSLGLLEWLAGTAWRQGRLLILCYHSLSLDDEHQWRPALFFEPELFDRRLDLLARLGAAVLPLEEALVRLRAGTLPPRSVVLTFDDGSCDFASLVWPRLAARRWPATVYVSTYYAERRLPVFHLMCSYLLWKGSAQTLPADADLGIAEPVALQSSEARQQVHTRLLMFAAAQQWSAVDADACAARLARNLDIDYANVLERRILQLMTPEEIRAVSAAGADVQLHTHRHRVPRNRIQFLAEITDNRQRLEMFTGKPAVHFCYPSGEHHPEFLPWLAEAGVRSATTCEVTLCGPGVNPLLLPRLVDTSALAPVDVEAWVSGVRYWVNKLVPRGAPMQSPDKI